MLKRQTNCIRLVNLFGENGKVASGAYNQELDRVNNSDNI